MKREKIKKTVLTKTSKGRPGRQRTPDNLDACSANEVDTQSNAAACFPDGQAKISTSATSETTATTNSARLEPEGSEHPQKEGATVFPSEGSSDEPTEEIAAASIGNVLQQLAFFLGDEEYGIDIRMVKEIIRLTEITPVPRAPSYIRGIISLRGAVLPILDLCRLLSMPDSRPTKTGRILVVSLEEMLVGIMVDAVTEVVELKEEELQSPSTLITNGARDHVIGLGRYKDRLIILLDLEKLYSARHGFSKALEDGVRVH